MDYKREKDFVHKDYPELITTIRHYSNLRFAMMTVFFGATAGLLAAKFRVADSNLDSDLIIWIRVGGLIVTHSHPIGMGY